MALRPGSKPASNLSENSGEVQLERWLVAVAGFALILVVACAQTPKTFNDPQGDFSITYPTDWEEQTRAAAAQLAELGSDFQMAFAATRYLVDDSGERIVAKSIPAASFMVKRGVLPPSWTTGYSDRSFLEEWIYSSIRQKEPTATNFSRPIEVRHGNVVGMEIETTYSETISLRRFFRVHGDTVLEVICAAPKRRWDLERKGCRELLRAFAVNP